MRRNVDFEFSKNWGSIQKKSVISIDAAFARSLQDVRKVGKILGPTKSKEDIDALEEAEKLIRNEVDSQVGNLKKETAELKKENIKLKKLVPGKDKTDKTVAKRSTK